MIKRDVFLGKIEKQDDRPDPLAVKSVEKTGFASNDTFLRDVGCEPIQKAWGEVLKHGDHDQSTHGKPGSGAPAGAPKGDGASSSEVREGRRQAMHEDLSHYGWTNTPGGPGEEDIYSGAGYKGLLIHVNTSNNSYRATYQGNEVASGSGPEELSRTLSGAARTSGKLIDPMKKPESSASMNYSGGPSLSGWSSR